MNKLFSVCTLLIALFFNACTKTTAFDFFSTDVYYEKAVSNLKKASIMKNMETKALLHAVYLNNVDPEAYSDGEYFFVAVYILEDSSLENQKGLNNPAYSLKMIKTIELENIDLNTSVSRETNSTEMNPVLKQEVIPLISRSLDENNQLRLTMPIQSQWNEYYLLKFESSKDEKLELSFESDQYGKVPLTFLKAE